MTHNGPSVRLIRKKVSLGTSFRYHTEALGKSGVNFQLFCFKGSRLGYFWIFAVLKFILQCKNSFTHGRRTGPFFPNSILLDIAKDGFTIIWRLSKNMNFHKIWRLWLKNCARHAHFNFELLKGVAASFFELYPSNFSQACIFYRQTNDVFTAKLYL